MSIKDFLLDYKNWLGGGVITAVITYFIKRKRNKAEANKTDAETENTSIEAEQRKLKLKIDRTKYEEEREQKIIELREELSAAKEMIRKLKITVENMEAKLTLLTTIIHK